MLTPQSKAFLKSLCLEPKRLAGETGYSPKDGKGKQPKAPPPWKLRNINLQFIIIIINLLLKRSPF